MIIHKLMENLPDYNYSQLADLLFNLRILYEDQTKLNHFIKECIVTHISKLFFVKITFTLHRGPSSPIFLWKYHFLV